MCERTLFTYIYTYICMYLGTQFVGSYTTYVAKLGFLYHPTGFYIDSLNIPDLISSAATP